MESIAVVYASFGATGLVAIGLIVTWVRNGRSQAKRDGVIEANQKTIIAQQEVLFTKLGEVGREVTSIKTNCATVSTSLKERVITSERDIKEMKTKVGVQ